MRRVQAALNGPHDRAQHARTPRPDTRSAVLGGGVVPGRVVPGRDATAWRLYAEVPVGAVLPRRPPVPVDPQDAVDVVGHHDEGVERHARAEVFGPNPLLDDDAADG